MRQSLRTATTAMGLAVLTATAANAQMLGYSNAGGFLSTFFGYHGSAATKFNGSITAAFGGAANVATPADLSGNLNPFSAIIVSVRTPSDVLSPAEAANLAAYIASGRRVVLFGENAAWVGWDASLLALVGATPGSISGFSPIAAPLVSNFLTHGVSAVHPEGPLDGIFGGSNQVQLFAFPFASLFEPQQNVLAIMDVNVCDDSNGIIPTRPGNGVFCDNIAQWLAGADQQAVVPEPATFALVGIGLTGLCALARRRATRAT